MPTTTAAVTSAQANGAVTTCMTTEATADAHWGGCMPCVSGPAIDEEFSPFIEGARSWRSDSWQHQGSRGHGAAQAS